MGIKQQRLPSSWGQSVDKPNQKRGAKFDKMIKIAGRQLNSVKRNTRSAQQFGGGIDSGTKKKRN